VIFCEPVTAGVKLTEQVDTSAPSPVSGESVHDGGVKLPAFDELKLTVPVGAPAWGCVVSVAVHVVAWLTATESGSQTTAVPVG
jgi:hypothetical protein